jgi:hypothetical protein
MARRKRRNRKKQEQGMVFPAPLALVLVVGALVALSYLWLCGRCEDYGRRIQELEHQKAELARLVSKEEYDWSNMTAPRSIERLLQAHNLVMTWPTEDRVIRLPMSAVRALNHETAATYTQYARRGSGPR